ncbi:MAG: indole-3-glycerol phosphate synthase TrpC [Anaerolineae bacterium]
MILDTIVAHKREELEALKSQQPPAEVRAAAGNAPPAGDFAAALAAPGVQLIAEIKRASPSKGVFRATLDPVALAETYVENGAGAISVLTDKRFFQGHLDDLRRVKRAYPDVPVLRKDFVIDPYQVYQARAAGADAVLLIVAVLADDLLADLLILAHELGMDALVEVHNEDELNRALKTGPRVIGINNRDLRDFTVDLRTTERLRQLIPDGTIVVAESGIHTAADVQRLARAGVDAILVGEALVTAEDAAAKAQELARAGAAETQTDT